MGETFRRTQFPETPAMGRAFPWHPLKRPAYAGLQSVDNVSALPDFEKARKSKKRSLQIHERTRTYVIGFAGFFDDESKNLFIFFSF